MATAMVQSLAQQCKFDGNSVPVQWQLVLQVLPRSKQWHQEKLFKEHQSTGAWRSSKQHEHSDAGQWQQHCSTRWCCSCCLKLSDSLRGESY